MKSGDRVFVPPGFGTPCVTGEKAYCCQSGSATNFTTHPVTCGW